MRDRPMPARWKRAGRMWWGGSRVRDTRSLHCRDHLFDQPPEPADVAGRVDGVAEADDHHALRWQDDDALPQIAGCEKRVARNAHFDTALGVRVLAAVGPEPRAVVGVERRGG